MTASGRRSCWQAAKLYPLDVDVYMEEKSPWIEQTR